MSITRRLRDPQRSQSNSEPVSREESGPASQVYSEPTSQSNLELVSREDSDPASQVYWDPTSQSNSDSVILATGTGCIHFQLEYGMLLWVVALYVPDFGDSLLSVPKVIKDGIDVSFCSHSRTAYVRTDNFTEQTLGRCTPRFMSFVLLGSVGSGTSRANASAYRANLTIPSHRMN
jgi:hypothetical protein